MTAIRVYEVDASEAGAVKKLLTYDPYLDPNLIPKLPDIDEKERAKLPPEKQKEIADLEKKASEASKKLREDKFMNVIFARQECDMRDARSIGVESDKSYLWIRATDEWLNLAEERFKAQFKGVKRASPDIEKKFIAMKEDEESRANAGFGSIFG